MYKNIDFYGKTGSIRNIRQIDDTLFEVEVYRSDGQSTMINKVTIAKEIILNNYLKDMKEYLAEYSQSYAENKEIIKNKTITKMNLQYLIFGIIGLIGIPLLALFINKSIFPLITVINTTAMILSIKGALTELITKESIINTNLEIEKYELMKKESQKIEQELEEIYSNKRTKFSSIKPKVEQTITKNLVKVKEK